MDSNLTVLTAGGGVVAAIAAGMLMNARWLPMGFAVGPYLAKPRLRRVLHALDSGASLELLIDKVRSTKSNEQFLREISKAPTGD